MTHFLDRPLEEAKGFCILSSALVYKEEDSKFALVLLERMENSPDRMYGKDYRRMNERLQRLGWKRLKESLTSTFFCPRSTRKAPTRCQTKKSRTTEKLL